MNRGFSILAVLIAGSICAHAGNPSWWTEGDVIDPAASHAVSANYAPVALGQLKNMAVHAKEHLDINYPGGAGSAIDDMVEGFEPVDGVTYTGPELAAIQANQYKAINLGQLKAVAKPFYDRLDAIGYDTNKNLRERGYPNTWSYIYPWNPSTSVAENYKPANLGQLKMAFSFDISDLDEDGVSSDDERVAGTNPFVADSDSDGYDDLEDLFPTDPTRHTLTATPGDTTPPVITLSEPSSATPL